MGDLYFLLDNFHKILAQFILLIRQTHTTKKGKYVLTRNLMDSWELIVALKKTNYGILST